MSTDTERQSLEAKRYKFVNHPYGAVMFFDSHQGLWPKLRATRQEHICRVSIEEVKDAANLEGLGYRTRNTIVVELPTDTFQRIRKQMSGRNLGKAPMTFGFQLNAEGSLNALEIDGHPIQPRLGRDSTVVPKDPPGPPGAASMG